MRIILDLQGTHGMSLSNQGAIYELSVIEEGEGIQNFSLEGSLPAFQKFFELGKNLVDRTTAYNGETDHLEPVYFGPEAELFRNL